MDRLDQSRRQPMVLKKPVGRVQAAKEGNLGVATISSQVAGTQCWEHL